MSTDPTRTKTLRADFERDCSSRLRSLKGDIREAIVELDVLQLGGQESSLSEPNPDDFRFLNDAAKRERFQSWLREQIDSGVLEPAGGRAVRRGNHWTAQYVRRAYEKGATDAGAKLRQAGVDAEQLEDVFNQPIHSSKIELIYSRTYDGLEGITQEMDTQMSRVLSEAMSEGVNPREAASRLNDRVDAVGTTRARTLAQTEIIHAHAEGTLDRYESEDFTEVEVQAEHLTAGDSRVCPECASLQGTTYTVQEARGLIPVHPRCRCSFSPVTDSD